eukprot:COSAG01_NODE_52701_length_344_cov_35.151020_1_plen_42_part_01
MFDRAVRCVRRYGPTRGDGRYVRELATFLTAQHGGSSGAVAP